MNESAYLYQIIDGEMVEIPGFIDKYDDTALHFNLAKFSSHSMKHKYVNRNPGIVSGAGYDSRVWFYSKNKINAAEILLNAFSEKLKCEKIKLKQMNREIALTLQTIGVLENILNTEVTE